MGVLVDVTNASIQGLERGELKGRIRGLRTALAEWKAYAEELERKVEFYRSEAVNGWAAWKAAEKITKDKFNYELRNDPDLMDIKGSFLEEMGKAVDNDVKNALKSGRQ